ncbi:MAG: BrxA/BrxB family bacilliredoxin [Candidatus Korobacteraceae bacterium]
MYPELMVVPMREELTRLGVQELRAPEDVDQFVRREGTVMIVVNSVCGCAAGRMRPAVRMALENAAKPDHVGTVFAGQDRDATARARTYFNGFPPSSPAIALLQDGHVQHILQRSDIEHREAEDIASELTSAFNRLCAGKGVSS